MTLIVAACDKPEAKPPTNIEKDDKADTDTDAKGESGGGSAGKMDIDGGEPADGDADKTGGKSGGDGEEVAPAAYSFAFGEASYKVAFTAGTYTKAVVETNKPAGDERAIEYTSSNKGIATVDDAGVVTFIKTGTVTITATKTAEGDHKRATASYELTITKMKPTNKQALVDEITRAMDAHGNEVNLNYIDVSDITNMSHLFSSDAKNGYGRQAFNGNISEWDVSKVTTMTSMFSDARFNGDISDWNVSKVTAMNSMFFRAKSFNQDISEWDVSGVLNMTGMFFGATVFSQNLNAWGNRINPAIKAIFWQNAIIMFKDSGLASSLPSWCASVPACKNRQG